MELRRWVLRAQVVDCYHVVDYYKAIGEATPLPLMIQTIGNMGTSIIGDVYKQVPTPPWPASRTRRAIR